MGIISDIVYIIAVVSLEYDKMSLEKKTNSKVLPFLVSYKVICLLERWSDKYCQVVDHCVF